MNVRTVIPRDAIPRVDDPAFRPVEEPGGDPGNDLVVDPGDERTLDGLSARRRS